MSETTTSKAEGPADVVVIDEVAADRLAVESSLGNTAYTVRCYADPEQGLTRVLHHPPALVLVDLAIPERAGFTVCERVVARYGRDVPVLVMTAIEDMSSKVRAMELGAVDYVTKPIRAPEFRARVTFHARRRRARPRVARGDGRLRDTSAGPNDLVTMAVHDLRTPLTGLLLNLQLIRDHDELAPALLPDVARAVSAAQKVCRLADSMLELSRLESGALRICSSVQPLRAVVERGIELLGASERDERLELRDLDGHDVFCDAELTPRVVANLLTNAISFLPPDGGRVTVRAERRLTFVRVWVEDNGPGVPEELRGRIFDMYAQAQTTNRRVSRPSIGVGLAFSRLALEAQGGAIGVEGERIRGEQGARFWFDLPRASTRSAS